MSRTLASGAYYITTNVPTRTGAGGLTFAIRFKANTWSGTWAGGSGGSPLYINSTTSSIVDRIGLETWGPSPGKLYVIASTNTESQYTQARYDGPASSGVWYHLTGTINSSGTTFSLYLNGSLLTTVPDDFGGFSGWASKSWASITIGDFDGELADACIYDGVLSASEIAGLYACRVPKVRTGLVGYWPLLTDSPLQDWSGNGRHLSIGSGTPGAGASEQGATWTGPGSQLYVYVPPAPMSTTYIRPSSGALVEVRTVTTSAGAGDVDKIPSLNSSGVLDASIVNSTTTSAGGASAGKLLALNGSGVVDTTAFGTTTVPSAALIYSTIVRTNQNALKPTLPITGTTQLASGTAYCVYLGQTTQTQTWNNLYFMVTTAGSGTQTAEAGIFTSPSAPNRSGQTLTKLFANGSLTSLTSTGNKTFGSAASQSISAGTHVWGVIRIAMGTTQVTLQMVGGDIGQGEALTLAGASALTGISTIAGAIPTAAANLVPWMQLTV